MKLAPVCHSKLPLFAIAKLAGMQLSLNVSTRCCWGLTAQSSKTVNLLFLRYPSEHAVIQIWPQSNGRRDVKRYTNIVSCLSRQLTGPSCPFSETYDH